MPNNNNKLLNVSGMHCASCASIIKRRIEKLPGVGSINVNFGSETANISFDQSKTSLLKMNKEIEKLGYSLIENTDTVKREEDDQTDSSETIKIHKKRELEQLKRKVVISIPLVVVSLLIMFWDLGINTFNIFPQMPSLLEEFIHHLMPIMASVSLFVVGEDYLKGVVRFVKYRVANMDTLVGIGTLTAFLYSFILSAFEQPLSGLINTQQTYYDVTIVVIAFITLGKFLEARSKLKTGEALSKLIGMQAKTAILIESGKEREVPISDIKAGDVLAVKPGQKIPLDGEVLEGTSSVDESMVTGESIPIDKVKGDLVIGATINKQGFLKIRVTKVGKDTILSQIIKMVEEAQGSKAPIERIADKISSVFVPLVLVFSFVVLAVWLIVGPLFLTFSQSLTLGLTSFVGILVIACPCAMGLATPMAVIVGVGKAAKSGILIKNAESLERFAQVNYVVMDKTGTITKGEPSITDVITKKDGNKEDALRILASLEKKSEHPLSIAVTSKAKKMGLNLYKVRDFKALEGLGVEGNISGTKYYAGSTKLAKSKGINIDESIVDRYSKEGKTPVILSDGVNILAYVFIADTIKDEAKTVVGKLHVLGAKTALLTGDNQNTAKFIAQKAGIDRIIANVLPEAKVFEINSLKEKGYKVAMVGDGINDAPSLAASDVGVAMGTGTDVAIESAGITLLGGKIEKLADALKLSRITMRVIKQNLFWAFIYNILGIPIAAGLLYPIWGIHLNPMLAGAAMAFSSISVVANSLRLKSIKI